MPVESPDVIAVHPLLEPPDAVIRVPGSKSITNRALLLAALAEGSSSLTGALFADDTRAMMEAIDALGAQVSSSEADATITVIGTGAQGSRTPTRVHARQSGTTSRFILPALALGGMECTVDGDAPLRARPFAPLIDALRALGVRVTSLGRPGFLPLTVTGPARGGTIRLPGHLSSQFLSGLMMAGPLMERGLEVVLTSGLISVPYLRMTLSMMSTFGVNADGLTVAPSRYRPADLHIEPDASAASYFFAVAAITGGRITVDGLGSRSLQGDLAFVDLLEMMGARVEREVGRTTVIGTGELRGIDIDMADISDTAQTLAAVAVFAQTPTRVRGIGFIRAKETDRITAIVTELRRAGVHADAHEDGFTVTPGPVSPARFRTYDDHRMAMSLALLGLRAPGVEVSEPGCVTKTYPAFFEDLEGLRH